MLLGHRPASFARRARRVEPETRTTVSSPGSSAPLIGCELVVAGIAATTTKPQPAPFKLRASRPSPRCQPAASRNASEGHLVLMRRARAITDASGERRYGVVAGDLCHNGRTVVWFANDLSAQRPALELGLNLVRQTPSTPPTGHHGHHRQFRVRSQEPRQRHRPADHRQNRQVAAQRLGRCRQGNQPRRGQARRPRWIGISVQAE